MRRNLWTEAGRSNCSGAIGGENVSPAIECAVHNMRATRLIVAVDRFDQEIEFIL
jgi:hypothetical protein